MTANSSLTDLDRSSLFHAVSSITDVERDGPSIYAAAHNCTVTNTDGQDLLDMGAGLWCVNTGYGRGELADAAQTAMRQLSFQHLFGGASAEPTIRLADRLLSLFRETTGNAMARVFFGTSGSDANDTAYKLVRYYNNLRGLPAKKKIISRTGAYHGLTHAATALTGIDGYHKLFDAPLDTVLHTSCPHHFAFAGPGETSAAFADRMIAEVDAMILREGADTIAAFIAEPVMGTGGVILPPEGYFPKLQKLLHAHDILLIADEVITGFGRTGQWFGCGTYGIRPDIVSLAKGLTSAYFPMSASLVSDRIWSVLSEHSPQSGAFMHGFTYSGHPVGAAVALANLNLIEREDLVARSARLGPVLLDALRHAVGDDPFVGDIRGVGLMAGVEFMANKAQGLRFPAAAAPHKLVAKAALAQGLMTRALPFLPVTAFSPPLIITEAEIELAATRYAAALSATTSQLHALAKENVT